eukprot:TRINITY_DN66273_c8_g1_i1.p1 TRINITY_DN66273_c8_g1~~TRINITY_DN66273_c8_g1_i1.p1  ORF type:complete len:942 (+),score=488.84 TRINITY_DN66273_c8_g1_i1:312-2828(+)
MHELLEARQAPHDAALARLVDIVRERLLGKAWDIVAPSELQNPEFLEYRERVRARRALHRSGSHESQDDDDDDDGDGDGQDDGDGGEDDDGDEKKKQPDEAATSEEDKVKQRRLQLAREELLPLFPGMSEEEAVELLKKNLDNVELSMVATIDHDLDEYRRAELNKMRQEQRRQRQEERKQKRQQQRKQQRQDDQQPPTPERAQLRQEREQERQLLKSLPHVVMCVEHVTEALEVEFRIVLDRNSVPIDNKRAPLHSVHVLSLFRDLMARHVHKRVVSKLRAGMTQKKPVVTYTVLGDGSMRVLGFRPSLPIDEYTIRFDSKSKTVDEILHNHDGPICYTAYDPNALPRNTALSSQFDSVVEVFTRIRYATNSASSSSAANKSGSYNSAASSLSSASSSWSSSYGSLNSMDRSGKLGDMRVANGAAVAQPDGGVLEVTHVHISGYMEAEHVRVQVVEVPPMHPLPTADDLGLIDSFAIICQHSKVVAIYAASSLFDGNDATGTTATAAAPLPPLPVGFARPSIPKQLFFFERPMPPLHGLVTLEGVVDLSQLCVGEVIGIDRGISHRASLSSRRSMPVPIVSAPVAAPLSRQGSPMPSPRALAASLSTESLSSASSPNATSLSPPSPAANPSAEADMMVATLSAQCTRCQRRHPINMRGFVRVAVYVEHATLLPEIREEVLPVCQLRLLTDEETSAFDTIKRHYQQQQKLRAGKGDTQQRQQQQQQPQQQQRAADILKNLPSEGDLLKGLAGLDNAKLQGLVDSITQGILGQQQQQGQSGESSGPTHVGDLLKRDAIKDALSGGMGDLLRTRLSDEIQRSMGSLKEKIQQQNQDNKKN